MRAKQTLLTATRALSLGAALVLCAAGASPGASAEPAQVPQAPKSTASSSTSSADDAVEKLGSGFLQNLDRADYEAAWKLLHPEYSKLGTLEQWRGNIGRVRAPLGAVRARELSFREVTDEMPHLTPGKYLVLQFRTQFEREVVMELVVLKHLDGAGWRVAGYSRR
jgi:hypothetical protein